MPSVFGYIPWEDNLNSDSNIVYDWVLTPQGKTTIDTIHTWDKGNPINEEKLYWNDEWYFTENNNS